MLLVQRCECVSCNKGAMDAPLKTIYVIDSVQVKTG